MPTADYQVAWPGMLVGPDTDYIVTGWTGWGIPNIRTSDDPAPQADGFWTGPEYMDGRSLEIEIVVRGDTPELVVANVEALIASWYLDTRGDLGYSAMMPLEIKMPGLDTRLIYVRPRELTASTTRIVGGNSVVTLSAVAPDPLWYSIDLNTATISMSIAATGYGYDRDYDRGYGGAVTSDISTITNEGSRDAYLTAVFNGPVVNPRLEKVDTGEILYLTYNLADGDTLVVDFKERTVLLNGLTSRYYAKTGVWFSLTPGDNQIRFTAGSYSATASVDLAWRDASA